MTLLGNLFGHLFGDSASEFEARGDQFAAVNNWRRAYEEYDRALQKTSRSAPGFRRLAAKLDEARLQSFDSLVEDIHSRIDVREFTFAAEQIEMAREIAESRDQIERLEECRDRLRGARRYEPRTRAAPASARPRPSAAAIDPQPWREDPGMGSDRRRHGAAPTPAAELQRRFRQLLEGTAAEIVEERVALGPRYQEATLALAEGRAEDAVTILTGELDDDPHSSILFYDLGVALQAAGRHSEAVDLYRRRIGEQPADWQAWYEMALAMWQRRTREEALRAVEEGLERHPRCGHLMAQWGVFLHKLGRPREALEKFYLALQLDSFDDPGLYHTIANLHRELGEGEKARRGYLKALELEPRSVGTQLDYAEYLIEEKQDARAALAILDTAFRAIRGGRGRPLHRVYASFLSSRAHMLLGEREMALLAVTRALEDNDQDWMTASLEQQRQAVLSV